MATDILEEDGKIKISHTLLLDEKSLVLQYRENTMGRMIAENILAKAPEMLESTKAQIGLHDFSLEQVKKKIEDIKKVLTENNIDIVSGIEEVKKKYTEEQILEKTKGVIFKAKTEIKRNIDGSFEMITTSLNDVDDVLLELMNLEAQVPQIIEYKVKEEENLKKINDRVENTNKAISEYDEKIKAIKIFFAGRHKDVDKLLDEYANARKKDERIATALPEVKNE